MHVTNFIFTLAFGITKLTKTGLNFVRSLGSTDLETMPRRFRLNYCQLCHDVPHSSLWMSLLLDSSRMAAAPTFQVSAFLYATTPPSENKQETIQEFEDTFFYLTFFPPKIKANI